MNDQYSITNNADRSVFAPSPSGKLVPIYREGGACRGDPQWISALRIEPPELFGIL